MSILFCYWGSICENGITRAFGNLGYDIIPFKEKYTNKDLDTEYIQKLADAILSISDIEYVFSVNYIPIIAKTCTITKTIYLSWVVDSPCYTLYSKSLTSPYCHTFLFDYSLYEKYSAYFPNNVHYLALGGDIEFYDAVRITDHDHKKYDCDLSFIGSFHSELCKQYDEVKDKLPEYMQGYIDGLINSQLNIYGYYLIEDSINDNFAESFRQYAEFTILPDYIADTRGIVADHYIGFKCNQQDRIRTLQSLSNHYKIDLYTNEDTSMMPAINNRGIADSSTMMPKIFKCSKINLNITAKTIKTGIPQRVFDIMSAGGFVISNYQPEISEYFIPDEDIVMYENVEDLIQKIEYYLNNDEERIRIAKNGYLKVKENYNYTTKLSEMFNILNHPK